MVKFQGYNIEPKHVIDVDNLSFFQLHYLVVDISSGKVIGIVGARCEGDVFDELCDQDRLDQYQLPNDATEEEKENAASLGNASELFDIVDLQIFKLPTVVLNPEVYLLGLSLLIERAGD